MYFGTGWWQNFGEEEVDKLVKLEKLKAFAWGGVPLSGPRRWRKKLNEPLGSFLAMTEAGTSGHKGKYRLWRQATWI